MRNGKVVAGYLFRKVEWSLLVKTRIAAREGNKKTSGYGLMDGGRA